MAILRYADPPYLGCCGLYDHHHPDGRCWDDIATHRRLFAELAESDGWVMHLSSPSLPRLLRAADDAGCGGFRIMPWCKSFAAFKANVPVAYAWEPVLVAEIRKPVVAGHVVMRDFIVEPITLQRGFTGAKPERVCRWLFEVAGAEPTDELDDMFPGSGAVSRAWDGWRNELTFDFGAAS